MSSKAYAMTVSVNTKTCYVKFDKELQKESDISGLLEFFKDESQEIENYIYDLSELKILLPNCYRVFTTIQHLARSKSGSIVVVIPPALNLKRKMMDDGLIRPNEICISLASVKDFVRGARQKLEGAKAG